MTAEFTKTMEVDLKTVEVGQRDRKSWRDFPWWLGGIAALVIAVVIALFTQPAYLQSFRFIITGLGVTIYTTLAAFAVALVLGLFTGLGRLSQSIFLRNITTLYVELVRGVPMLVLIFFIAFVGVPAITQGMQQLGATLVEMGWEKWGAFLAAVKNSEVPMNLRAITALAITYGAFLAEVFRAGIESVSKGQMEAALSQGMSRAQAMRYIILPQGIRNVLPALGNDFISMLKDSSLVSVLAVRDITQVARLHPGTTFHFREAYLTLAVLYLSMTLLLSILTRYIERRTGKNGKQ